MSKGRDKRKLARRKTAKRKGIGCKPSQEIQKKIARKVILVFQGEEHELKPVR